MHQNNLFSNKWNSYIFFLFILVFIFFLNVIVALDILHIRQHFYFVLFLFFYFTHFYCSVSAREKWLMRISLVANFIIFNFSRFASTPQCNKFIRLCLLLFTVSTIPMSCRCYTYMCIVLHTRIHIHAGFNTYVSNHNNFTFYAFVVSHYYYYFCCSHWLFIVTKSFTFAKRVSKCAISQRNSM